jgi:photosystem II stability/assembly factor-like uncharacterized protein
LKRNKPLLLVVIVGALAASTWFVASNDIVGKFFAENDPDMPVGGNRLDHFEFIKGRTEYVDERLGYDTAAQDSRANAIAEMERAERALGDDPQAASWVPIGPAPIPVGSGGWSGRTSAIAVHPTNPDIAYVGTAQGGLYRTLNGGQVWTQLMDRALSLAIGAVAIAPSDPTIVYVGTGESTQCSSGCFAGVGVYRITNADTNPVLSPVLNRDASNNDVFTGRAISEVLVHPTDPNTIFVSSTSGVAGLGASNTGRPLPVRGVYRSVNAMSGSPTFERLPIGVPPINERNVTDIVMEPGEPNHIWAGVLGDATGNGGVWYSDNALSATPTWTRTLSTSLSGSNSRVELAANKVAGTTTVIAASGDGTGTVHRSVNGAPFTLLVDNNFCNPQCFYDVAVAIDPTDANRVYLGGSPTLVFGRSTNGGTSFTSSASGLHVDTQAITVAPSNPLIVYFGSDGGIWRTINVQSGGAIPWTNLNNSTFSATQFMGVALHPLDRNYTLGGTQDNGTEFLAPDGRQWINSDGGDGGFAAIDQTSPSTTNIVAYHTYYNQSGNQIGFARATSTVGPGDPNWTTFYGCGGTANGINCADQVLFYAPMVIGPSAAGSNGNSLYFGTNRLYRSIDRGVTMTDVSGTLAVISAIAVAQGPGPAPNDDIRLVGTTGGGVYASTTAGATTMTSVSNSQIPARYVGRVAIDPTDPNVAYVCLNGFGLTNNHVMKTTNLLAAPASVTWAPAGAGIPDTPVDSFAIDPMNTQHLYAGTDIGVFRSTDGGASWTPFSNGLPRVAVFGMAIQPNGRVLRIATHGRGMWDYQLGAERTAPADFNGDGRSDLAVYRPANGTWYVARPTGVPAQNFDATQFGNSTDTLVPGDYDGDGRTDHAVYRASEGNWYILRSSAGFAALNFGLASDLPAQGDYDGDGRTDVAVFRPSTGIWYMLQSTAGFTAAGFGANGDRPVAGDYDADGKTDVAVFRPADNTWYVLRSTAGFLATQFGAAGDKVVPGDYDGDAKTDIAVYRDATGSWYRLNSFNGAFVALQFGSSGDIPTPGDYDGDGKIDLSVFRPSDGNWYRLNSSNGSFAAFTFGTTGDIPVEARYVPAQ